MVTTNVIQRTFNIRRGESPGTAFTIDRAGRQYLVTARHVIEGIVPGETLDVWHEEQWTGISVLPAPDGFVIHPRAAERTKFCSSHHRPAPEAVTSARADVRPTGAPAFRAFLRHRSTLVLFLLHAGLHCTRRASACRHG